MEEAYSAVRLVNRPIKEGMVPVRSLVPTLKYLRLINSPTIVGMVPVRSLSPRCK